MVKILITKKKRKNHEVLKPKLRFIDASIKNLNKIPFNHCHKSEHKINC